MKPLASMKPADRAGATSFFHRLGGSARAALQWRLLLLWMAGLLLPTVLMALPVFQLLSQQLDHSVRAPQMARALDLVAIADLQVAFAQHATLLANAAVLSVVLTLLLSPWLTGMAVSAARAQGIAGFRELAAGGLREYPRMLRMLLLAIVLLGAAGVPAAWLAATARASASTGWLALAALCALASVLLVHASLDAGRAVMALDRRRTSELGSWWQGCKLLRRRLWSGLALYAAITLIGLGAAALFSWLRLQVPGIGVPGLVGAFALSQAIVGAIAWMRIARLFAMVELAR